MATATVPRPRDAEALSSLLNSPEMAGLIRDLEATRWTGRPGYPIRAMIGMALVKSLNCHPTWTRTVALVAGHAALRGVLGCSPSLDACYRFTRKLRAHHDRVTACIEAVLARLAEAHPEMGEQVAIDGSDLPAYANGQRYLFNHGPERKVYSDPDASWGHRSAISTRKGGGFYGYKVHAVVDVATELPVAWKVETARDAESPLVPDLLDAVRSRGFDPSVAILDRGYDNGPVYEACEARGIRPIIPLRETPAVKAGKAAPPECEHGTWTFAGSDAKRGASKWRCPTCECSPASVWIKADRLHTLVPRSTKRWKDLYKQRGCVERGFGRLKHEWGLLPLRVRQIDRVRLHVDLTILAQLVTALEEARAFPLAA
jgi:DDE family transposase